MPTRAGSKKKSAKKTPKKTSAKKTPKKKPTAKKPAAKKPAAKKPAAKKPAAKKPAAKKIPTKKSPAKVVAKPKATPATKSRVQWRAQINCEGGPVMVASAAAYAKWTGATRLPGAPPTVLHYWGQFTAELPEKFQPNGPGGHQYLKAPSHEAARALADELREAVKKRWPKAKDDWKWKKHDLEASFRLPDHRHMQLELATPTEYELACNAIDADTGVHHFADQAALFWEVQGGGAAHVGIADDSAELVLLRWWVDEDEYMDAARALVDTPRRDEDEQEATFTTKDGLVIVAWAAAPRAALKNAKTDAALRALVDKPGGRMDAEGFSGIGTVQRVRPGTYMARCGAHEADGWSCIWLRLNRRP